MMNAKVLASYPDHTQLEMLDLTIQSDEGGFVIGSHSTGNFLAIPEEAAKVVENFQKGLTLGAIKERYVEEFNEVPDLDDFIGILIDQNLARVCCPEIQGERESSGITLVAGSKQPAPPKYHFENISQATAKIFFSKSVAIFWLGLLIAAIGVSWQWPQIIPKRSDLLFLNNYTLNMATMMVLSTFCVFLHEMAHLLAARAEGVSTKLGISHRLWVLVAETDMTGIWSIPKRKRYLPFLAGPLLDVAFATTTLLVLATPFIFNWEFTPALQQFLRAFVFVTFLRLVWQCYFFVRTDFYYVFSTFFNCRSLMGDTKVYLWNMMKRLFNLGVQEDQSAIPESERKVIKYYSIFWIGGRGIAFFILLFVMLPVSLSYLKMLFGNVQNGISGDLYVFLDSSLIILISFSMFTIGLIMWFRSIFFTKNRSNF